MAYFDMRTTRPSKGKFLWMDTINLLRPNFIFFEQISVFSVSEISVSLESGKQQRFSFIYKN